MLASTAASLYSKASVSVCACRDVATSLLGLLLSLITSSSRLIWAYYCKHVSLVYWKHLLLLQASPLEHVSLRALICA